MPSAKLLGYGEQLRLPEMNPRRFRTAGKPKIRRHLRDGALPTSQLRQIISPIADLSDVCAFRNGFGLTNEPFYLPPVGQIDSADTKRGGNGFQKAADLFKGKGPQFYRNGST